MQLLVNVRISLKIKITMKIKLEWIKYRGTNLKKLKEFGIIRYFMYPEKG
jgi:hypothetical protein